MRIKRRLLYLFLKVFGRTVVEAATYLSFLVFLALTLCMMNAYISAVRSMRELGDKPILSDETMAIIKQSDCLDEYGQDAQMVEITASDQSVPQ